MKMCDKYLDFGNFICVYMCMFQFFKCVCLIEGQVYLRLCCFHVYASVSQ